MGEKQEKSPINLLWLVTIGAASSLIVVGGLFWLFAAYEAGEWTFWDSEERLGQETLFGVGRNSVTLAAALGVGVTLFFSYRKQQTAERAQQLATEAQEIATKAQTLASRTLQLSLEKHKLDQISDLRKRYALSAEQLGSEKYAVQIAGLHSLGALADDWAEHGYKDQQQVCVSLLCSFISVSDDTLHSEIQKGSVAAEVLGPRMQFRMETPMKSWGDQRLVLDKVRFTELPQSMQIDGGKWVFNDCSWIPLQLWKNFAIDDGSTLVLSQSDGSKQMAGFNNSAFRGGVTQLKQSSTLVAESISFEGCVFDGAAVMMDTASKGSLTVHFVECTFISGTVTVTAMSGQNTVRFIRCHFGSHDIVRLTTLKRDSFKVVFHGCTYSDASGAMQQAPSEAVLSIIEEDFDDLTDLIDETEEQA